MKRWPVFFAAAGWLFGAALLASLTATEAAASDSSAGASDIFDQMAGDVSQQLLANPALQEKTAGGKKVKIVVGDITNDSTNYDIRVQDVFNQIRNQLVSSGLVDLYAPGELDVDFIISPELTSREQTGDYGRHRECYTLNLTLNTPSGRYIASLSSKERCN